MSAENPLDLIRSMNEKKEEEKKRLSQLEGEKEMQNQDNLDQEYDSLEGKKLILAEDIESFKQKMADIKGSREEMIAQYHEAIAEAKKNPETLEYVRNNFTEIFKDNHEKWQVLRDELDSAQESEQAKNEEMSGVNSRIEEIFPQTSQGKEQAERDARRAEQKEEYRKIELKRQKKLVDRLKENIANAKEQKEKFSDILDQVVEYTREKWDSGEAKIISDDAKEFTKQWQQFPVNPWVISAGRDCFVEALKEKNYSDEDIESYKEKKEQLNETRDKIYNSFKNIEVGFAKTNDISYPAFPYLHTGHGNHYFDSSLLGQQMPLGELFDKEIEIKTSQLAKEEEALNKIEESAL